MEIKIVKKVNNDYFKNKNITALYSEEKDLKTIINNDEEIKYFKNMKVKYFIKSKYLLKELKLSDEVLNKKVKDLSLTEFKFVMLIKATDLNPELIVLNNIEKGIAPKLQNALWHYIKNITLSKNIKFVLVSKDITFINKITNKVIVINNKIIRYQGYLISGINKGYLPDTDITSFIKCANEKGAKLTYTLDRKELLKDIYRRIT